jgi:lysine 2,3-aminomutase
MLGSKGGIARVNTETLITKTAEDEPPERTVAECEVEEPPSTTAPVVRRRSYGLVPPELWNDWKWHFRNRITSVDELAKRVPVSVKEETQFRLVAEKYPISITPHYLSLIDPDDPDDPIRKQAIPCYQEIALAGMGYEDPLEERRHSVVPGLVHRYPDRALMVLTNLCPMLCRHCTRKREWQSGAWVRTQAEIDAMLAYIREHEEVRDVIMSGGDVLTLSTQRLETVLASLRQIEHVQIIRIGSRFPVVLPQRIDDELCAMLSKYGPIWLNTHFNHHREITPESAAAIDRLVRAGVPVNNQSVLLKGVNDTVESQLKLCQGLLRIKVRPYYLFQCDEVQGTEHLHTPIQTGVDIIKGMRGFTSGLAIPTFVIDLPGGGGKVPLQPNYVLSQNEDEMILRNYEGRLFNVRNPTGDAVSSVPMPARVAEGPPRTGRRNGNRVGKGPQLAFASLDGVVR